MKETQIDDENVTHRLRIVKPCNVGNCENEHYSTGYCVKHYARFRRHGDPLFVKNVYGEDRVNHPLHRTYQDMKTRCLNPKNKHFNNYGGRGITVCDRWLGLNGFTNFCNDMGEKPTNKHTIDRKDNNKGYSKDNCQWATRAEQAMNRRSTNKHPYVRFQKCRQNWKVEKTIDGKKKFFGYYPTQTDAVAATIRLGFITK